MVLFVIKIEVELPTLMFYYLENMYLLNNSYINSKKMLQCK